MRSLDRFEEWNYCEEALTQGIEILLSVDKLPFKTDLSRSLAIIALFDGKFPLNNESVKNVLVNI